MTEVAVQDQEVSSTLQRELEPFVRAGSRPWQEVVANLFTQIEVAGQAGNELHRLLSGDFSLDDLKYQASAVTAAAARVPVVGASYVSTIEESHRTYLRLKVGQSVGHMAELAGEAHEASHEALRTGPHGEAAYQAGLEAGLRQAQDVLSEMLQQVEVHAR